MTDPRVTSGMARDLAPATGFPSSDRGRATVLDDETVAAAKLGDPDAWRLLYAAHAGRLLVWLAARPVRDCASSPEDIAAEAWLTAARRIPDFHGTSDEFAGWLFGIGRKIAANRARAAVCRSTPGLESDEAERHIGSVEGPDSLIPGSSWVRAILATLPRRQRDVIACMEVVGLDAAGTARALGMSPVAVRVARHRGLRRLREALSQPDYQPPPAPLRSRDSSAVTRVASAEAR